MVSGYTAAKAFAKKPITRGIAVSDNATRDDYRVSALHQNAPAIFAIACGPPILDN